MFTACAFWMMKIITTARATTPVIRPVRMPLIRVLTGRRGGAGGTGGLGGGGGAEPLTEGGGSVLVAPCGSGVAVMALLLPEWERAAERLGGSAADPGWASRLRLLVSRCPTFTLPMKNETSNLFPEILIQIFSRAQAYLEFARAELGEQVAIYLRPQRWLSADLGPGRRLR
jgi:hypothetical protein